MGEEFVSLHSHSELSLLDGLATLEEYSSRTKALGQRGLGITDHGNVFSAYKFLKQAQKYGIIGVPGMEAYMAPANPEGAFAKRPIYYGRNGQKAAQYDVSSDGSYLHLTLWATTHEGLRNLFKLSTLSYDPRRYYSKPRIDFGLLEEHSAGLVVATGCPSSEISTRFLLGQDKAAYEYASRLKEIFGRERLFVEVMNHNMTNDLERLLLPKQVELSKKLDLGLLATNDSHYAHQEDAPHHEEMLCIQSGSWMSDKTYDEGGRRFAFQGSEYYLKSNEEMSLLFPSRDFPGALSNTLLVTEMAEDLRIPFDPHLRPSVLLPEGHTEESYFKHLINKGFKARYGDAPPEVKAEARKRILEEFEVFHSSDFIGYMLTVYDYLQWTRDRYSTLSPEGEVLALPVGAGRGSVGGSIIAYLLNISELDPIKHDLIFERFLSAGRGPTYRITYDDGTFEDLVASETRSIYENDELVKRYVHQLEPGECVEVGEGDE